MTLECTICLHLIGLSKIFLLNSWQLTLERNFDGFEVLSDMRLAQDRPLSIPQADLDGPYQRVVYIPIFIPAPDESAKPRFLGDIHLLKGPVASEPPKVFDARRLKDALAPYVTPILKSRRNITPHIHEYLLPAGKLDASADR